MKVRTIASKAKQPEAEPFIPQIAEKRHHVNSTQRQIYTPSWTSMRPGADNALTIPSRIGNRLHYRDGRVGVVA